MSDLLLNLFICRDHGRKRFLEGGTNNEKIAAPKINTAICSVYTRGAHIYHNGTNEEWQPLGVLTGQGQDP